jgi:tetratricopeptide (TPR) repeat protein
LKAAESELAEAQALVPNQEEVVFALGEVRRRRKELVRGAEGLTDFVKNHPDKAHVRMLYATLLRESGQADKAMRELREVLVRGRNPEALAELALCHLAKNEPEPAELLAKQAVDMDPKGAAGHRALGLVLLTKGDDALSFQAFQKATAADPKEPSARMNMGVVLLRAGAYPKAEEQFRAIFAVDKDDTAAQVGLAAALRGQADGKNKAGLEEARTILERVLAREPKHAAALFNLGVLYTDFLKRPADAKPLFQRYLGEAAEGDPSRAEAQRYLAALPPEPKGKP